MGTVQVSSDRAASVLLAPRGQMCLCHTETRLNKTGVAWWTFIFGVVLYILGQNLKVWVSSGLDRDRSMGGLSEWEQWQEFGIWTAVKGKRYQHWKYHRTTEWLRSEGSSGGPQPQALLQQGPSRAGYPGPGPGALCRSPRRWPHKRAL